MKILNVKDYTTTNWSGGQTTELHIFPQESTFAARDFLYRISIATIQVSSSDFTPLAEVERTLLLLEGELKLIHENHHESFLMPFSQDHFKGDWNTHSIGIAKDFNLMTKKGCNGTITVISNDIDFETEADHILAFAYQDSSTFNGVDLNEGELAIIDSIITEQIPIITTGKIIIVEIHLVN